MRDIEKTFESLKNKDRCALIPYFMAYYPNRKDFNGILAAAGDAGADLIEIGIPFSDPIADGPTIQEAGQKALANGASIKKVLGSLEKMRGMLSAPIVIMTYANLLVRHGLKRFFSQAYSAGARGAVIPDLSLEECDQFREAANNQGIDIIQFIAPTTPDGRLKKIAAAAQGFIYMVSVTGVTGARPGENFGIAQHVKKIRKLSGTPVCVGFGISTPEQAASVASVCDGIIIGSAIIEQIKRNTANPAKAVYDFLKKIRKSIDSRECR